MRSAEHELEDSWQSDVIALARMLKWRVAHFRPALTKHGWRTPVAADGKGFPDLMLTRERVVYAELKSPTGRVAPEQAEWIAALRAARQEVYLWRPADWDTVVATLRHRQRFEEDA